MSVISNTFDIDFFCKYKSGQILSVEHDCYHCFLNKNEIKSGTTKKYFFVMQIVATYDNKYIVYTRCNINDTNDKIFHKEYVNQENAISLFVKIFKQKTGNNWNERHIFISKNGKYTLMDPSNVHQSSILGNKIIELLQLLTNFNHMESMLMHYDIDIKKLHPFKISYERITKAYNLVNMILKNLDHPEILNNLNTKYNKLIPRTHYESMNNTKLIGKNINMLNDLLYISHGLYENYLIKKGDSYSNIYCHLKTKIEPLDTNDNMYPILQNYIQSTKSMEHQLDIQIIDIYIIDRDFERNIYSLYSKTFENKMLLFHGICLTNIIGVLKNGLKMDLIKVNREDKMFGQGIYFTNCSTKCVQNCMYYLTDNLVCFFIAEVALGNILERNTTNMVLTSKNLPKEFQSIKGNGRNTIKNYNLVDNIQIPFGHPVTMEDRKLLYDEYVVYHEEQINLRYLVVAKIVEQ